MRMHRWLIALTTVALLSSAAFNVEAQNTKTAKTKRAPNPAFAPVTDKPGLPRVLLIGDSISIGYTVAVQELMQDTANVHRIPTNGGPTTNGLKNIDTWLGDSKWDVIHFNWGLHDLKYIAGDSAALADPKADGAHQQVPIKEYEQNLKQLVERMQKTGATLIWCSTTPVPEGSNGRVAGDEKPYNEAAARVMASAKVGTDDLCTFAAARLDEIQLPKNVHFSPAGSKVLAEKVSESITEALKARSTK